MRIAVLILALATCFFLFLQSALINGFTQEGTSDNTAAAFGVLMSLLLLISAAVVIPVPRVAMSLLVIVGVIGIIAGASSEFSDLIVWGIWGFLLSFMAYLGFRGKRKQQAKETARDQIARDALAANQQMAAQLAYMQQQIVPNVSPQPIPKSNPVPIASPPDVVCPSCGTSVPATAYYCSNCRAQLRR